MLAEQAKREEARRAALRERIAQRTRKRELQQLEGPRATVVGAAPAEPSSGGDDDEEDFDDRYQGFYSAYHRGGAAEGGSSGLAP